LTGDFTTTLILKCSCSAKDLAASNLLVAIRRHQHPSVQTQSSPFYSLRFDFFLLQRDNRKGTADPGRLLSADSGSVVIIRIFFVVDSHNQI
jgi:hypothetical protein